MLRTTIVIAAALGALFPTSTLAYGVPERDYWQAFMLQLINESREEFNLSPVGLDEDLTDIAQAHAADTAAHFDDTSNESRRMTYLIHTSSDRGGLGDRIREYGITGLASAAENVGFRYRTPFEPLHGEVEISIRLLHEGMMAEAPPEDGHKRTILGDFTHVGIGLELHRPVEAKANTLLLVTDFAKFTDGRLARIPEPGAKPGWIRQAHHKSNIPRTATGAQTVARTPEVTAERRMRRTRAPFRAVDVRKRRVVTDMAIPRRGASPFARASGDKLRTRGTADTQEQPRQNIWLERHRARLEKRQSGRLDRLLRRVEEKRQRRLERR